jgi:hypothetical protein
MNLVMSQFISVTNRVDKLLAYNHSFYITKNKGNSRPWSPFSKSNYISVSFHFTSIIEIMKWTNHLNQVLLLSTLTKGNGVQALYLA